MQLENGKVDIMSMPIGTLKCSFLLAVGVIAAGLSSFAAPPAHADLGTNCRTVIRSPALGGNYTRCAPKGTMTCIANRCTISKLPPPSRTALRPVRRGN